MRYTPDAMMLENVPRDLTLTERAQQQLEELIVSGRLAAGKRLPSESEMAKMLGVSRTVVREAVRLLSAKGLVDVRTGSGIYVRQLSGAIVRDPIQLLLRNRAISIDDIVEARVLLEVHLAGVAAERARPSDINAMQDAVDAVARPGLTPLEYAEQDVAFHARIAAASRNPLFVILSETINAVMAGQIEAEYQNNPDAQQDTIREHSAILNRVRTGDVSGARAAMELALAHAPDHWRTYGRPDNAPIGRIDAPAPRRPRRTRLPAAPVSKP
jgi:GntR family transcriptional repressor for pyruvate dehydrogenase complex